MKNKPLIFGAAVILVIILIVGGLFLLSARGQTNTPDESESQSDVQIKEIKADEIGLILALSPDKKVIKMEITKLDGVKSIEYEGSYDAVAKDEESGEELTLPRGVGPSTVEVDSSSSTILRNIDLGTCSRNVCKYDNVTSDITFVIRVNYSNGEVGQVEQVLEY